MVYILSDEELKQVSGGVGEPCGDYAYNDCFKASNEEYYQIKGYNGVKYIVDHYYLENGIWYVESNVTRKETVISCLEPCSASDLPKSVIKAGI